MGVFSSTCFVSAILASFAGVFVLLADKKNKLHQSWFLFNLSIAVWLIGLGFTMLVETGDAALFWQKVLYIGTIFIPVFFVQFSTLLTKAEKKTRKIFSINLLLAAIFVFSLFATDLFVKGVKERTVFGYWPFEVGWLYYPFLFWFFVNVVYGFILLKKGLANRELDLIQQQQVRFMFYGALIGFSAGSINFLLDFNIVIPPYYNFLVPFYLLFVGYAIVTKQLFGIKVILTEILVGIMEVILLILPLLMPSLRLRILTLIIFLLFCFIGYLLIRYTLSETKQKEILEEKVKERTKELERAKNAAEERARELQKKKEELEKILKAVVGRELKMIELKKIIANQEERIEKLEKEKKGDKRI